MKIQNQWLFEAPPTLEPIQELELLHEFVGGIPIQDYFKWVQFSLNMYFKKTMSPPAIAILIRLTRCSKLCWLSHL
jgi:hypothetical protein